MKKLYGVVTAMTTPFDLNGVIDIEALKKQTDFLISKGVHCLYPCGTTGEMYYMTLEERMLVAETVVRQAAGRVTVYIHVGAMDMKETVRLAKHAVNIGADGIGIVTPSYFTVSDDAMVNYYKEICDSLPDNFPVYVYVIPQLAHNDISYETMQRIVDKCKNVIGVKYSFGDIRRTAEYRRVNSGEFSVVTGADDLLLPCLSLGCDGCVSGCSGPFPEAFVQIYSAYCAGDLKAAYDYQVIATDIVHVMKAGADMSIFKNVLDFRGVPGGHVRKPLIDLQPDKIAELRRIVEPYLQKYANM